MKRVKLNIQDIFNIPTAVIHNPDLFKSVYYVSIDSRIIKRNSLFIAIKGEKFDGHNFIKEAINKGATAIMIDEKALKIIPDYQISIITVKDTVAALGDVARIWRSKINSKVIGITGSSGKTTTKEILAAVLAEKFKVQKTTGNNNNHIGVPLTILSTNEKHKYLVLELGTNHFGEIPYTAKIALPDISLITNIGNSHLEFLKNRKGVFKEKSSLFIETLNGGGKIFINNDDNFLSGFGRSVKNKTTFSAEKKSDYQLKILFYDDFARPQIEISSKSKKLKLKLPFSGDKNALNFTAAYAVASELGVKNSIIKNALKNLKLFSNRARIIRHKNFTLIDDTYNSNPDSMKSAIEIIKNIKSKTRKIAVLGDMFELGRESKRFHEELANIIKRSDLNEIYSIGNMMKFMDKKLAVSNKKHFHFGDRESLIKYLTNITLSKTVILVKGSRGMKMEEFARVIVKNKN